MATLSSNKKATYGINKLMEAGATHSQAVSLMAYHGGLTNIRKCKDKKTLLKFKALKEVMSETDADKILGRLAPSNDSVVFDASSLENRPTDVSILMQDLNAVLVAMGYTVSDDDIDALQKVYLEVMTNSSTLMVDDDQVEGIAETIGLDDDDLAYIMNEVVKNYSDTEWLASNEAKQE